jgi:hypothetical protein
MEQGSQLSPVNVLGALKIRFFVCQAARRSSFRMSLNEVETALRNTIAVPAVRTNRTRHASIRQDVAASSARTIGPISGAATFATSSVCPPVSPGNRQISVDSRRHVVPIVQRRISGVVDTVH